MYETHSDKKREMKQIKFEAADLQCKQANPSCPMTTNAMGKERGCRTQALSLNWLHASALPGTGVI